MTHWVRISSLEQCPVGSAEEVVVDDRIIALYHVPDGVFALDGICPHQGGPLARGKVEGCIVTCPWHGWQYDIRSGQHQSIRSLVHKHYPVKVEGSDIYVDLDV